MNDQHSLFDPPGRPASPKPIAKADVPLTVGALTRKIAGQLEDFGTITVQGELSLVKVAPSGHLYATLKDPEAVISLVMWRSTVVRQSALPKEGTQVVVRGTLGVYGPRGAYQLTATKIEAVGAGDLMARFLALKAKLEAEGLFAQERKRPLPFLPRAVGLATASGSAALADLLHSIRARFPAMPVVHAPCLVQGAGAAASIAAALDRLGRHPQVDVVICGRGGGSIEDLWAFNEEAVVRAIARCPVPVISAVGHETDTTLADFVADQRAKTPTAAGELVVPVAADLHDRLSSDLADLDRLMDGLLAEARARLAGLAAHRALAGPRHQVDLKRQRLDELAEALRTAAATRMGRATARLDVARAQLRRFDPGHRLRLAAARLASGAALVVRLGDSRLRQRQERLAALAGRLDALSPLAVIARGYSVIRDGDGLLVRSLDQVPPGTPIRARLADGWLHAEVTSHDRQRLREDDGGYRV